MLNREYFHSTFLSNCANIAYSHHTLSVPQYCPDRGNSTQPQHDTSPAVTRTPTRHFQSELAGFRENILHIRIIKTAQEKQTSATQRTRISPEIRQYYIPVNIGQQDIVTSELKQRRISAMNLDPRTHTIQAGIVISRLRSHRIDIDSILAARIPRTAVPHPISITTASRMEALCFSIDCIIIYVVS